MENVPKLRFPEFQEEWEDMNLGQLVKISTGKKDTQDKVENGKYPFFVRSQTIERINSYSYDGEAILTAGDGVGVGKVFHYINDKFDFHQRVYKLSDFEERTVGRYIYEYFKAHFIREVTKYTAKTSVDSVRMEMLTKMRIPLPSRKEQERIAHFLFLIEQKIEKQQQKTEALHEYKKGMMQKIFSQEIRFKGFTEKWETKPIGSIASLVKDGTHGTHKSVEDGPYLLSAKNIQNGKIVYDENDRKITWHDYESIYSNYKLEINDILLSIVGTIGRVAMVKKDENIAFQRSVAILRFHENMVIPKFVYQVFYSRYFQNELKTRQVVSAQPGIYLGDIKKITIAFPALAEQQKIADFLSMIDDKIDLEQIKLEALQNAKKGFIQQMFA